MSNIDERPKIYLLLRPAMTIRDAMLWMVVAVLVGMMSLGIGIHVLGRMVWEDDLLNTQSVVTDGQIKERWSVHNSKGGATYYVVYTFVPTVGSYLPPLIEKRETVSWEFYDLQDVGDSIQIIYVPDRPQISRIQALYPQKQPRFWPSILGGDVQFWPLLVGIVGALIAGLFAGVYKVEYDHAVRLEREGVGVKAELLDLFVDKGGKTCYVAYAIPGKRAVRHSVSRQLYERLQVGDSLTVWYVPRDPRIFRPEWSDRRIV